MSDLDVSMPTPEEMLAELKDLRADRAIGAQLLDAARAHADQDSAALREVTSDRDRWQSAAESLRSELWRQVDELRAESGQQRHQITQLSLALSSLLEAIVGTTPSDEAVDTASELSAGAAVEAAATELATPDETAAVVDPDVADDSATASMPADAPETPAPMDLPCVVPDVPAAEVVVPAVVPDVATDSAPAPSPAPAPVLAPYVPANEPPRPHLETKPEPPTYVPNPDHDRVGVLTELMAVAVDSVPETATGTPADRESDERPVPNAPNGMTILPAAEPVPTKRRRLRGLSG